jgi:glyoxylase-like metal-dependent hydrolase (beta-lactamase superfamily II)
MFTRIHVSMSWHLKFWVLLVCVALSPSRAETTKSYTLDQPAPGSIRFTWIYGSIASATNTDPRIQVQGYNEDTYILRENLAVHWEAPFTYLLFGNNRALLIDTGATPEAKHYPLRATVDAIVKRWCKVRGKPDVPLTVVLTSGEDIAQNQAYAQFADRPNTTLAPQAFADVKKFFGLSDSWPASTGQIDLGGRVITVIPTPGTHKDGLSFYDPYNAFLHTGDFLFPGRILIANDGDYVASIRRLKAFVEKHPVKWIMGGHLEMTNLPGVDYARRTTFKPSERLLQMEPQAIDEAAKFASEIVGKSEITVRSDFILMNRVGPGARALTRPPDLPPIPAAPAIRPRP